DDGQQDFEENGLCAARVKGVHQVHDGAEDEQPAENGGDGEAGHAWNGDAGNASKNHQNGNGDGPANGPFGEGKWMHLHAKAPDGVSRWEEGYRESGTRRDWQIR